MHFIMNTQGVPLEKGFEPYTGPGTQVSQDHNSNQ